MRPTHLLMMFCGLLCFGIFRIVQLTFFTAPTKTEIYTPPRAKAATAPANNNGAGRLVSNMRG